jgi:hypothetical protein
MAQKAGSKPPKAKIYMKPDQPDRLASPIDTNMRKKENFYRY